MKDGWSIEVPVMDISIYRTLGFLLPFKYQEKKAEGREPRKTKIIQKWNFSIKGVPLILRNLPFISKKFSKVASHNQMTFSEDKCSC